jgi:hypothetical protein
MYAVSTIAVSALKNWRCAKAASAAWQILLIICTAAAGFLPFAVSPLSITASAPSSTADATSTHSARVGRAFVVMLSSICVAQMTGLPCAGWRGRGWRAQARTRMAATPSLDHQQQPA